MRHLRRNIRLLSTLDNTFFSMRISSTQGWCWSCGTAAVTATGIIAGTADAGS